MDFQEEMLKHAKRQSRMATITAAGVVGIMLIIGAAAISVMPKVNRILDDTSQISSQLAEADIVGALEGLGQVDIDTLNKAIQDLSNVVAPLAGLFGN